MKRKGKIFIALLAVALLLCIAAVTLAACDPKEQSIVGHTGRYYEYNGGIKDPNLWVDIQADGWVDDAGLRGTYKLSGSAISLYCDGELLFEGTLENGVLTIYILGVPTKYYKDGFGPSSGSQTPTTPDEKPEEKPENTKCTVTYHANGGIFSGDNEIYSITVNKNSKLTAPTSPTRLNHTFFGWSKKSNSSDLWNFDTDTVESDLDLYAVWQQRSAVIFSVEGASIDGTDIFMLVDRNTTQVSLSNMIVCSNDSTWELYYDSLGQTKIPTKIAASKNGHLNDGANDFWIVVTSKDNVQTNVYQLTVYRSYAVPVNYMDGLSLLKAETAYTGYEYSLRYTPNIKGYKFNGWKIDGETATTVTPWGAVNVDVDKTANKYQVNFNENGGTLSSGDKAPVTVTYDDEFDFPVPSRTGYSFKGWEYDGKLLSDLGGNSLTGWDIAQSVTVKAKWEANQYKVTIKSGNVEMGTVSDEGDNEWDYDSTHTLTANTNEGCTFMGWYDNDKLLSRKLNYQITVSTTNPTYTAKWYKIQIAPEDKSQGITVELNNTYIVGQEVYIEATPYLGYDFAGWYVDGKNLSQEEEYIYIMPENETKVIAKFSVIPEMANYTFTSSMTECNITGIVDTSVEEIIIPDYVTGVYSYAFDECDNVTSATIPAIATGALPKNNLTTVTITSGEIQKWAFEYCTSLQTVTLGEGVQSIGLSAFYVCTGLQTATINAQSIGDRAFESCTGLQTITIGESVTSIGASAFHNCTGLQTANWNATNCIKAGSDDYRIFEGCTRLTTVNIGDEVQTIPDYAFYCCISITKVNVTSLKTWCEIKFGNSWANQYANPLYSANYNKAGTAKLYLNDKEVTGDVNIPTGTSKIGSYAFYGLTNLTSVNIPDSVTSIGGYAFEGCTGLQTVTIGEGVTSIGGYAFWMCTDLQTVYWNAINCAPADFDSSSSFTTLYIGDNVQTIPYDAFRGCIGLSDITIPDSVTSIGYDAFYGCYGLQTVTIGKGVTSIGDSAFSGCTALKSFVVDINNATYQSKDGVLYIKEDKSIYLVPKAIEGAVTILDGCTSIDDSVFKNCRGLTEITIPDSVTGIGNGAFSGCDKLVHIRNLSGIQILSPVWIAGEVLTTKDSEFQNKLERDDNGIWIYTVGDTVYAIRYDGESNDLDLSLNKSINAIYPYAFYACTRLTSVTIPDSVTSIGEYAFKGCTGLKEITIPDSVTSIGEEAFYLCTGLQTAEINVQSIGDRAFEDCYGLQTVTIGKGVTSIGDSAFSGCTALKSFVVDINNATYQSKDGVLYIKEDKSIYLVPKAIEGAVTILDGCTSIGNGAFSGCTGLSEITIPDSVTSIGNGAFEGCTGLQTAIINAQSIGDSSFRECTGLQTVTIGEGVQSIGAYAFYFCTGIKNIYYPGDKTQWENIKKGIHWNEYYIRYDSYLTINYQLHYNSTGPERG